MTAARCLPPHTRFENMLALINMGRAEYLEYAYHRTSTFVTV